MATFTLALNETSSGRRIRVRELEYRGTLTAAKAAATRAFSHAPLLDHEIDVLRHRITRPSNHPEPVVVLDLVGRRETYGPRWFRL